jgi:hypothetical protein
MILRSVSLDRSFHKQFAGYFNLRLRKSPNSLQYNVSLHTDLQIQRVKCVLPNTWVLGYASLLSVPATLTEQIPLTHLITLTTRSRSAPWHLPAGITQPPPEQTLHTDCATVQPCLIHQSMIHL